MTATDLFPRDTAGLPLVERTTLHRLRDGDRLALEIAPVVKDIGGSTVRMIAYNGSIPGPTLHVDQGSEIIVDVTNNGDVETTVHWHGLRLDNRFDGVPIDTQAPIEIGGVFSYRIKFPDPGFYWYHPHLREDYGQEMGMYGTIIVEPADSTYWPRVDRQLSITLDDLLIEDGMIAPFSRSGPTFTAMGRFGNVLLVNGEERLEASVALGEVVRLHLVNTANTRIFNVAIPDARMKLVGGDSGRYQRETFVEEVLLAPSERAIVDVQFDRAGVAQVRTPDAGPRLRPRRDQRGVQQPSLRGSPRGRGTHDDRRRSRRRPRPGAGQDPGVPLDDAAPVRRRGGPRNLLRLSHASGDHVVGARPLPEVRHEIDAHHGPGSTFAHTDRREASGVRVPDAPRRHRHRSHGMPEMRDVAPADQRSGGGVGQPQSR